LAIAPQHRPVVVGCSIAAGIVGLVFGWFPGADLGFLAAIWLVGLAIILATSPLDQLRVPVFRILMALIGAGFIIAFGVEVVTKLTLPVFFIVNPILNALATYRMLRTASKLFASDDAEELSSNVFANIVAVLGLIFAGAS
jgi:hypothetical protein